MRAYTKRTNKNKTNIIPTKNAYVNKTVIHSHILQIYNINRNRHSALLYIMHTERKRKKRKKGEISKQYGE